MREHAHAHQFVDRDDRIRFFRPLEEPRRRLAAALEHRIGLDDPPLVHRDARFHMGAPEAIYALFRQHRPAVSARKGDPPAPHAQEVTRQEVSALGEVRHDTALLQPRIVGGDEHQRQSLSDQRADVRGLLFPGVRGDEDQSVHVHAEQPLDRALFQRDQVLRDAEQEAIVAVVDFVLHGADHAPIERVGQVGDDKANVI